jgi:DNA replication and repair protein RecF
MALFEHLGSAGGQVWMTGTEPSLFDGIGRDATRLSVRDGAVREESSLPSAA